jgi:hypothetical protein
VFLLIFLLPHLFSDFFNPHPSLLAFQKGEKKKDKSASQDDS